MPNLIDVVAALGEVFDRLQLQFAVGGALANNYWGIVRATVDVDCLIALPKIKYQVFADEFNAIGCTLRDQNGSDVPVTVPRLLEQVERRKLIECYYQRSDEPVRVELFLPAVPLQDEILRRAVPIRIRNRELRITTAEDLILLKLAFHRVKDLQDVRGILWVQRGRLDMDYLRHWSARTHESDVQQELEGLIEEYSRDKTEDS
jgi:predicted nucleotidyltransferase